MKYKAVLLIAAVIVIGAAIRAWSSIPIFITELVYQPPVGGIIPPARNPEAAVRRFYMLIDDGQYEEAYKMVIEPDWVAADSPAPYREQVKAAKDNYNGLVSKEEFVSRGMGEMGPKGLFLTLGQIKASEQKISEPELPWADTVEYPLYSKIIMVKAWGDYVSSCAIFRWEKDVPVIKTQKGYRIILEGTKKSKEMYHLSWLNFSEKRLIKHLRDISSEEEE